MLVAEFNEQRRLELLARGRESLFVFGKGLCRFPDLADIHQELCEVLQGRGSWGPWNRGLVVGFRGSLKSSIATILYPVWCALYPENLGLEDHSTLVLGNSYENVVENFIRPAITLFRSSAQADFLQWLYRHRLPDGLDFSSWSENIIRFRLANANSQPALTGKGIGADQEGKHVNLIVIDDPEGADAAKSKVVNIDTRRAINSATPLLINPKRDRILLIGTPHGDDPIVYRALRQNFEKDPKRGEPVEWDNRKRIWKQYWKPVLDENDKPVWPERFDEGTIQMIRSTVDRRTWEQQYLLRESISSGGVFSRAAVERGFFAFTPDGKSIEYKTRLVDAKTWYEKKEWVETEKVARVRMDELRYYLHMDLIHREDTVTSKFSSTMRPSRAAIVIVGVAPDGHCFVVETWTAKVGLEEQVRQAYRLYQKYGCSRATWDSIGAQVWFRSFCEANEKKNPVYQSLKASDRFGRGRLLPRLSSVLVEDKRTTRMHKEDVIFERLAGWIDNGFLHLHENQVELTTQIFGAFESTDFVDLIDALAQGPPVWDAPAGRELFRKKDLENKRLTALRAPYTGFYSPFRQRPKPNNPLTPPDGDSFSIKSVVN